MTALIGGSVLLVVASTIALVFGWSTADENLIWTSIGASIGAAILLVVAVLRSRKTETAPAVRTPARDGRPSEASSEAGRPPAAERHPAGTETLERPAAGITRDEPKPEEKPAAEAAVPAAAAPAASRPSRTKGDKAAAAAGRGAAAAGSTAATNEVIAVPDRKRFHRASCRYASAKGAERMSKASARRRGYAACGVCKP